MQEIKSLDEQLESADTGAGDRKMILSMATAMLIDKKMSIESQIDSFTSSKLKKLLKVVAGVGFANEVLQNDQIIELGVKENVFLADTVKLQEEALGVLQLKKEESETSQTT